MSEGDIVLVTGATGYIATHILQQLLQAGYRVRGTVRNLNDERKVAPLRQLCPEAAHPLELVEANLLAPETWPPAVADCKYVLHTASPLPFEAPSNEDVLVKPALEGTLNVLNAVREAKCVKRVVLTSSVASMIGGYGGENGRTYTEEDWTDCTNKNLDAYPKSKTLAEKAAWDFVAGITDEDEKFELSVINPGLVIGPVLCGGQFASAMVPKLMMDGKMMLLPRINSPMVDVRDVAKAHIAAMTIPEAAGHRHILVTSNLWFKEMAQCLHDEFGSQGYSISLRYSPYFLMWMVSWFQKSVGMLIRMWDCEASYNNDRMLNVLKIEPHPVKESFVDMVYSMIERGIIKKTDKYQALPAKD